MEVFPRKEGVPVVDAVCRCGHHGKSAYPEHYQCSVCYYANRATGKLKRAEQLEARARKLREESAEDRAKSDEALRRRQAKKGAP